MRKSKFVKWSNRWMALTDCATPPTASSPPYSGYTVFIAPHPQRKSGVETCVWFYILSLVRLHHFNYKQ